LDKYKIPEQCRLPMKEQDIKTGKDLLEEDFVKKNPGWVEELTLMVKTKQKAEILALGTFGSNLSIYPLFVGPDFVDKCLSTISQRNSTLSSHLPVANEKQTNCT